MMTLTRNEIAAFLLEHDHYCILTHRRPDGDTVGSSAALCRALRSLGKTAHILQNEEVTARFQWLHQGLTKEQAEEQDTIITVDVAAPRMLPKTFEHLLGRMVLRIDHHASGISFTDRELVEPNTAACAEIIYDLLLAMGVEMDAETADAIYVGTSTDTGCFRFSNTNAHTFQTAAACARAGARIYELNQVLFETNTLEKMKMQAWIVDHMQVFGGGKLAVVAIPKAVELEIGVTEDDMDNISNFPRTVAGVCMAATLRETRDGDTKISVRAVLGYDATRITGQFGGGGHKGAAGANVAMPIEAAARAVAKAMLNS